MQTPTAMRLPESYSNKLPVLYPADYTLEQIGGSGYECLGQLFCGSWKLENLHPEVEHMLVAQAKELGWDKFLLRAERLDDTMTNPVQVIAVLGKFEVKGKKLLPIGNQKPDVRLTYKR